MNEDSTGLSVVVLMLAWWLIAVIIAIVLFRTGVKVQEPRRRVRRGQLPAPPDFNSLDKAIPFTDSFVAGCFICDGCGRRSYFDLISRGDLLLWPKVVDCQHCTARFGVTDPNGQEQVIGTGE